MAGSKLNDLLGLVANTLDGELFTVGDTGFEIRLTDTIKQISVSVLLLREIKDGKKITNLSFRQNFFDKNNYGNSLTFREIEKLYLSVSPGSEVAFLFSDNVRFNVINVYKNCLLDVINGPERRKEEDESLQQQAKNMYEEINKKKKENINKRRIFITI